MRAIWWSLCPGCGQRIHEGDEMALGHRGGRQWWLCLSCSTQPQELDGSTSEQE